MTISEIGSQITRVLFNPNVGCIKAGQRFVQIFPRGRSRTITLGKHTFVTQDPKESGIAGHLTLEGYRIVWIEVDRKRRGDGYFDGEYTKDISQRCLEVVAGLITHA